MLGGPPNSLEATWKELGTQFDLKRHGKLTRYLGIDYDKTHDALHASQTMYATHIYNEFTTYATARNIDVPINPKTPLTPRPSKAHHVTGSVLSDLCKHFIGALLYLARGTRPDLMYSVAYMARFVDKWEAIHDCQLARLISYAHHSPLTLPFPIQHKTHTQCHTKHIHNAKSTDADHAACTTDRKSVSGWILLLKQDSNTYALDWLSKKQTAVSLSSGEAELIAMTSGIKAILRAQAIITPILGYTPQSTLFSDSQCAITVATAGVSASLGHLGKTHGISLGWIRDTILAANITIAKISSYNNTADMFTKLLPAPAFLRHRQALPLVESSTSDKPVAPS